MHNYCTLFDSNYLTRGIAMYESLKSKTDNFHLYILAFDDKSFKLLSDMSLEFVSVISLKEFEDEKLLNVKQDRSIAEYCWTCTPSIIKYCLDTYGLSACTYLDADIYFFNDPNVLIEEMKDASVLITEHRYTQEYDQSLTSGIYCVQFMTFKNDAHGMLVLNWWRNACISWCYARCEDGKFGDQKYLDGWPDNFEGVHVLKHLGGGVAPWNVQQYSINNSDFKIVFYHFHHYRMLEGDVVDLGAYKLSEDVINNLYRPYAFHLQQVERKLISFDAVNDYNGIMKKESFSYKSVVHYIKRLIKGTNNVYKKNELIRGGDGSNY